MLNMQRQNDVFRQPEEQSQEQPQTTILFIRHTDVHNPDDILYGRLPRFGLSDLGRQQAERTASVLAEEPVAAFYTSPQLRARQTTRILAQPHPDAQVHVSRLLAEVLTGWEGTPHSELHPINYDFYASPKFGTDETLEVVWKRLERFIAQTRRRHPGEEVVAVSHGDPLMLVRAVYSGLPVGVDSIRLPHVYTGKGSILRLPFPADLKNTYPLSLEYYDPNGQEGPWVHAPIKWRAGEPMPTTF